MIDMGDDAMMILLDRLVSYLFRPSTMAAPCLLTVRATRVCFTRSCHPGKIRRCFSLAKAPLPSHHDDDTMMPFYALGTNLAVRVGGQGNNIKKILKEDELEIVLKGFCDSFRGKKEEGVLAKYGPAANQILRERQKELVEKIKQQGSEYIQNFMISNKEAIQTDSGLVYLEITKGDGKQPTVESAVEVHYHGTLTDGTVFDSSVDRGTTVKFMLASVIDGWKEGLLKMKEGGRSTLVIPPELAYGDRIEAGESELYIVSLLSLVFYMSFYLHFTFQRYRPGQL
jgi:FKBP-type peptidyl-prolyl cis-trans isomerase